MHGRNLSVHEYARASKGVTRTMGLYKTSAGKYNSIVRSKAGKPDAQMG
ncbi:hypothetical protein [Pseudochelatococcus contaminans]|nr:hypothetical protein [Pseudochelatococcus contaminans]